MKLLLDTHILLWSQQEPERVTPELRLALDDMAHEIWVSPISWWEVGRLVQTHRVEMEMTLAEFVDILKDRFALLEAPVTSTVVLTLSKMRFDHADPADQFLAATARCEGLTLVTADDRLLARTDIAVWPAA